MYEIFNRNMPTKKNESITWTSTQLRTFELHDRNEMISHS